MDKRFFSIFIAFILFAHGLSAESPLIIIEHNGLKGAIGSDFEIIEKPLHEVFLRYDGGYAIAYSVPIVDAYIFHDGKKQKINGRHYDGHIFSDYFLFCYPDKKGKTMVNCKTNEAVYDDWGIYKSSQPIIPVRGADAYYYIDPNGEVLFGGKQFNEAFGFVEDYAVVALSDWSYAIINSDGEISGKVRFEVTSKFFSEGLVAGITKDGKSGYFDVEGRQVVDIPLRFYELSIAATEFSGGYALVSVSDGRWRIIDRTGRSVKEIGCEYAERFCEGYSLVSQVRGSRNKFRFVGADGAFLTGLEFDDAESFCNGYARIAVNGKDGILDREGNIYLSEEILQGKKIRHSEIEFQTVQ